MVRLLPSGRTMELWRVDHDKKKAGRMKYYTIVFPGEFGQHVQETWRTDQILKVYWKSWNVKMFQSGNGDLVTEERCIEDWITTHWAEETNEFGDKL